jgi:long-subunit acyl-CoA synthetase (AMP-forming)
VEDIALLKPTIFPGVPRVFDRVYNGVISKVRLARTDMQWALRVIWSEAAPGCCSPRVLS